MSQQTQSQIDELLDTMTSRQLEFIQARLLVSTDKEAAEAIGITRDAVNQWKKQGVKINEVLRLYWKSAVELAVEMFQEGTVQAAETLFALMRDSKSEQIKFQAAKEILDRGMGKSVQRSVANNSNEIIVRNVNDWRNPTADPAPGTASYSVPEAQVQLVSGGSAMEEDDPWSALDDREGSEREDSTVDSANL